LQSFFILFVCMFNVLFIVYNLYTLKYPSLYDTLAENSFFLKEFFYIAFITYYSTSLNSLSNEINSILLNNIFPRNYREDQLYTYNLCTHKQIVIKTFGLTVQRKTLISSFSSFCLTIIVGLIRMKLLNSI